MRKSNLLLIIYLVILYNPSSILAQGYFNKPECVIYDSLYSRYLVSNVEDGRVIAIDSNGTYSVFWTSPRYALGSCLKDEYLYLSVDYAPGAVVVLNRETGEFVRKIILYGTGQTDGMTTDSSGNLYVVDMTNSWVLKIELDNEDNYTIFAGVSASPQDIYFDAVQNRLIVAGYSANAPVQQITLPGGIVSDIVQTPFGYMDGMARDNQGRYYFGCAKTGQIYRYDSTFTNPPTLIASGFIFPSNIGYDQVHDILMVPNYNGNKVDFIGLSAEFASDTTYGNPPLTVNFSANSINYPTPDSWQWDFGDDGTAEGQSVSHTYSAPGLYTVDLGLGVGPETFHRRKKNLIFVPADTLFGPAIDATVGSTIAAPIHIRNTVPLRKIVIPLNYSGDVGLHCDSVSIAGCSTGEFLIQTVDPFNNTDKELVLTLDEGLLAPGNNLAAYIYLTVESATGTRISNLTFETIDTYQARFIWNILEFPPDLVAGRVRVFTCGDANGDVKINLLDVSYIIGALYRGGPKPDPIKAADVNHDGKMNLLDVSYIISFLYRHGPSPSCP